MFILIPILLVISEYLNKSNVLNTKMMKVIRKLIFSFFAVRNVIAKPIRIKQR